MSGCVGRLPRASVEQILGVVPREPASVYQTKGRDGQPLTVVATASGATISHAPQRPSTTIQFPDDTRVVATPNGSVQILKP